MLVYDVKDKKSFELIKFIYEQIIRFEWNRTNNKIKFNLLIIKNFIINKIKIKKIRIFIYLEFKTINFLNKYQMK